MNSADATEVCKKQIERMLKNSQTKVIMPVITFALLTAWEERRQSKFTDKQIQKLYDGAVAKLKNYLGHDVHIGARYYDAYGSRMSRYNVLSQIGHLKYELQTSYKLSSKNLIAWIPEAIRAYIDSKLGIVPSLGQPAVRLAYSTDASKFMQMIQEQIGRNPSNFEVFSFAVLKVHLEKFACRIYRDTRTSAHDKGVDLSTNFGAVYQVKKLSLKTQAMANEVLAELKLNFDSDRFHDGNVIIVIDDISKDVRRYLIDMKVQAISKEDVIKLASNFDEPEDRQKVLRVVHEEFRREYSGTTKL